MKIYVEKRTSKKTGPYVAMVIDFGYRKAVLSFDYNLCAEALNMTVAQMYDELNRNQEIEVDMEGR